MNTINPRHPHFGRVSRNLTSGGSELLYEGECRSSIHRRDLRSSEGSNPIRALSIPVKRDDWQVMPLQGDIVEVNIGKAIEFGSILDYLYGNLGSTLFFKLVSSEPV